ncbi:acyl carrier protein [Catenulispora yoronensis]
MTTPARCPGRTPCRSCSTSVHCEPDKLRSRRSCAVWSGTRTGAARDRGRSSQDRPGAARPADFAVLSREEGIEALIEIVRAETALVLGYPNPGSLSAEATFKDLGADSLSAVELRNRLGTAVGLRLSAGLIFDHPTPVAVARHVYDELVPDGPATPRPRRWPRSTGSKPR